MSSRPLLQPRGTCLGKLTTTKGSAVTPPFALAPNSKHAPDECPDVEQNRVVGTNGPGQITGGGGIRSLQGPEPVLKINI